MQVTSATGQTIPEQQKEKACTTILKQELQKFIYLPFGENFTKLTGGLSSSINVFRLWPLAASQMRQSRQIRLRIEVAAEDVIAVPLHRLDALARAELPDFECFVIAARNEQARIG